MSSCADADQRGSCEAQLRARLVERLVADGNLRSPTWKETFGRVPRHVFVPSFFREGGQAGEFDRINRENENIYGDWLSSVYDDDVLLTQIDATGVATSSSTTPGLMALMLEALDIEDGMNVLEIGTGTGYNTALLCDRLGSEQVTSIDIDRELIDAARERLASLGYAPCLGARDGMTGYQENAPYARIIATVAVPSIPVAWIRQSSNGGRMLANLYRELGGGALALLTVHDDCAQGRFVSEYGGFMPIRALRPRSPISLLRAAREDDYQERVTQIAGHILGDQAFTFFAALLVPAQQLGYVPHDGPEETWLLGSDGSWAKQTTSRNGGLVVCQHGPRLLWDALEQAYRVWIALGSPLREDFGLTVTAEGKHTLWNAYEPSSRWTLEPGCA